jgi:EAL domain-containing protein (putative c-di-GMP-specific phosphodiesterase class I)
MTTDTGGIDREADNRFLIRALTDAAHSVDIEVIAQAVETSAERNTLEAMHLDGVQGFPTGNPQPLLACKQTTSQALSS